MKQCESLDSIGISREPFSRFPSRAHSSPILKSICVSQHKTESVNFGSALGNSPDRNRSAGRGRGLGRLAAQRIDRKRSAEKKDSRDGEEKAPRRAQGG